MPSLTEQTYPGEFLISESNGRGSRDDATVTVLAGQKMVPGTVLGKITATGKYVPYDDRDTDGRENAAAILYGPTLDATDDDANTDFDAVIIDFAAEVRAALLVWVVGASESGGLSDLAALGIKARN